MKKAILTAWHNYWCDYHMDQYEAKLNKGDMEMATYHINKLRDHENKLRDLRG